MGRLYTRLPEPPLPSGVVETFRTSNHTLWTAGNIRGSVRRKNSSRFTWQVWDSAGGKDAVKGSGVVRSYRDARAVCLAKLSEACGVVGDV